MNNSQQDVWMLMLDANKLYRVYIIHFSNLKNDPTGHGWSSIILKLWSSFKFTCLLANLIVWNVQPWQTRHRDPYLGYYIWRYKCTLRFLSFIYHRDDRRKYKKKHVYPWKHAKKIISYKNQHSYLTQRVTGGLV